MSGFPEWEGSSGSRRTRTHRAGHNLPAEVPDQCLHERVVIHRCLGGLLACLLTGNVERGARIKLGHHGLSHFFKFGAFADDSQWRNELGPVALRRARELHGVEFTPERVFVIGDTPHDIACGKVIGARTIAVATGQYSLEELNAHTPHAAFSDLSDTAAFLRTVGVAE